ncbi:Fpg/Nei family DNA glycosylase [Streptomyces sp. NPDC059506]|uniref:Fpg/Nei family DNA glycosylase n=1 Tax=Streptomyces sp. NPDC059506 TaxID=3347751 RepID=UPI00367C6E6E
MPEGDTVWLTARRLHEALAGRVLTAADLRVPALATAGLAGRRVLDVTPRGKHLLTRLEGGATLHSHLRMDGSWHVYAPGERWRGGPQWQVRAVLATAERVAVGYRLPVLELLPTSEEHTVVGHLGPDPLGPDWDPHEAVRRMLSQPDRAVGEALLDQRNLAGVGNVYKCELCFLRGVSPWTPVGQVRAPDRMAALAARLLRANRERVGHVTTGDTRRGRTHWVYGRAGLPCLRCGTPVLRAGPGGGTGGVTGGTGGVTGGPPDVERVTYWCPRCQPGPAPAGNA